MKQDRKKIVAVTLTERLMEFITDRVYCGYILLAIVLFGGIGVWSELFGPRMTGDNINWQDVHIALSAYYPALIGAATLKMCLDNHATKRLIIFSVAILIVCLIIIGIIAFLHIDSGFSYWMVIISSVISLGGVLLWGVANVNDTAIRDEPPINPDSSVGKDTKLPLRGDPRDFG